MYAHPRCYASRLGTCSSKITKEHYVSHGVLKRFGDRITIIGATWLGKGPKTIPIATFAPKVLCEAHNATLSALDNTAKNVFDALLDFDAELSPRATSPAHRSVRVSGWEFERWFLKVYCGMHAAGHLKEPGVIPEYVIESLFNDTPLPMDLGLYMAGHIGQLVKIATTLGIQLGVRPDNGDTFALGLTLAGVGFHCSIRPARDGGTGKVDDRERHVPGIQLHDQRTGRVRELDFEWAR
jgi:hypothetical protein